MKDLNKIELLSPAGSFEGLKAAVGNGADSVYFGAERFSARGKAHNFSDNMMEEAIDYAHLHSVKAYLAINTLISDHELDIALDIALSAYEYGIDAIIIQDLGFAALVKEKIPGVVLHASTQAAIYDKKGVNACKDAGISRIILPREFSISEISELTEYAGGLGIETEIFIHGALCVSYSGQCLMSSLIGARSGNRGECAQPCRLSYTLMTDNKTILDNAPVLATKDMSGINFMDEVKLSGVKAVKIEGRMKSPEYAGIVTNNFRKILDNPDEYDMQKGVTELLLSFNRGGNFTGNYLSGLKGPDMMAGNHPGSFGIYFGNIVLKNAKAGIIDIMPQVDMPDDFYLDKGDVLSVRRGKGEGEIVSAPVGSAEFKDERVRVKGFHPDAIEKININDKIYLMEDASLKAQSLANDSRKTKIKGKLFAENEKLILNLTVTEGIAKGCEYTQEMDLHFYTKVDSGKDADFSAISEERCIFQLTKMKSSPFNPVEMEIHTQPKIPVSALNALRREAVAGLEYTVKKHFKREIPISADKQSFDIEAIMSRIDSLQGTNNGNFKFETSAFFYYWDGNPDSVICGATWYEIPVMSFYNEHAFEGVARIKNMEPGSKVAVILPPGARLEASENHEKIIKKLSSNNLIDAVISGNPGINYLADESGILPFTDISSNIFNSKTALLFMEKGVKSILPSAELSKDGIVQMVKNNAVRDDVFFEIPVYGRLRLMYTEHCPVGFNRKGCSACSGKECMYYLKDRKKASFPVVCHPGECTADILNSDILCSVNELNEIKRIYNTRARLIFFNETPYERKILTEEISKLGLTFSLGDETDFSEKIKKYADGLAGKYGSSITRGHYNRGVN